MEFSWNSNQFTENIDWDDSWTAEWIGGGTDGQSQPLNGLIDRTEVWNKPLNQLEIQRICLVHLQGNETGLVGFWNFNEGNGNVLNDLTNNGNNGTIN